MKTSTWFENWFYSHYRVFLCRRAFITQWTAVGGGSWQLCCVHEKDARGGWLRLHCRNNNASHRGADFKLAVCCGPHHQQTSKMNFRFVCPADVVCILTKSQNWLSESVFRHKHGLFQLLLSFPYFPGIFWKFASKQKWRQKDISITALLKLRIRKDHIILSLTSPPNKIRSSYHNWSFWIILFQPCPGPGGINPDRVCFAARTCLYNTLTLTTSTEDIRPSLK